MKRNINLILAGITILLMAVITYTIKESTSSLEPPPAWALEELDSNWQPPIDNAQSDQILFRQSFYAAWPSLSDQQRDSICYWITVDPDAALTTFKDASGLPFMVTDQFMLSIFHEVCEFKA